MKRIGDLCTAYGDEYVLFLGEAGDGGTFSALELVCFPEDPWSPEMFESSLENPGCKVLAVQNRQMTKICAYGVLYAAADEADSEEVDADAEEADDEEDAGGDKAHVARTNSNYGDVVSAAGWNITVEDVEINASLENVSVDLGYTGVETSDYKKEADTGKTFCLIKLKIEKDGSKESLDWAKLKLTDSEGNEYTRTDDEFITELGMIRMAGTTLNFGSNEGWIAFEINENADGLELSYPFEAEAYNYAL